MNDRQTACLRRKKDCLGSEQIIKNTDGHTYINVVQQTAVPTMKRFSASSCEKRLLSRYRKAKLAEFCFTVKEIDPDGHVWSRIRVCPGTQQEFQKRQKQAGFTAK